MLQSQQVRQMDGAGSSDGSQRDRSTGPVGRGGCALGPQRTVCGPFPGAVGELTQAPLLVFLESEIQNLVYWAKYMKSLVFSYFYPHRNFIAFNLDFPRF